MPIYEYSCTSCNCDFEALIRNSEQPHCPECGTKNIERRLSVPAAHISGSSGELPVCNPAMRGPCGMGGCGLPECG